MHSLGSGVQLLTKGHVLMTHMAMQTYCQTIC
jgi:hypothetical protein